MPHDTPLIATIVAGLGLAFVFGALANRFRMPPLVGYLIAGVLVGPNTPGFVADQQLAAELAEIGVILLMFGVGLHFSLKDLLSVRAIAVPGAIVQIGFATALGAGLAWLLGWSIGAGLVFGLALSVASHRGAAARPAGAAADRDRARPHRRRLADRRGSGHGAGAGAAAGAGRRARRQRHRRTTTRACCRCRRARHLGRRRHHAGQGRRLRRRHAGRRPPGHSLDPALCRPYRLARAVPAGGAGDRARRRLRRGQAVRRVAGARRLLRRHDHERIRAQPPRGRGIAAAARRLLGAVLRLGRHAVRSVQPGRAMPGRCWRRCSSSSSASRWRPS